MKLTGNIMRRSLPQDFESYRIRIYYYFFNYSVNMTQHICATNVKEISKELYRQLYLHTNHLKI